MNIYLRIIILLSISLIPSVIFGQQETSVANYRYTGIMLNPALAGSSGKISTVFFVRNHWSQFTNSPYLLNFNIHAPIFHESGGVGGSVLLDQAGPLQVMNATASYAYKINFWKGKLALGMSGGIRQLKLDPGTLDPKHHDDLELPATLTSDILPDVSAGITYHTNKLTMGISTLHIIPYRSKLTGINFVPHSFFLLSYDINSRGYFTFSPSTLIKWAPGAPLQGDFSLYAKSRETTFGISYRTSQIASFQLVLHLNELLPGLYEDLSFGYAYDHLFSGSLKRGNGASEFILNYNFKIYKKEKSIKKRPRTISPKFY